MAKSPDKILNGYDNIKNPVELWQSLNLTDCYNGISYIKATLSSEIIAVSREAKEHPNLNFTKEQCDWLRNKMYEILNKRIG